MKLSELELAGAVLYKSEGTKLRKNDRYPLGNTYYYAIELTNSDPVLIKIFLEFLRKVLMVQEERLRCELFIYQDHDQKELELFWSKQTKIPLTRFHKTILLKAKNPSKYKPGPLGTCKIRFNGKEDFLKLNQIIKKRLGDKASLI